MPENNNLSQIRSEEIQDILSKIPTWMIRWGSFLILGLICCVLFLSWLIKYPDVISGKAVFTTSNEPAYLYPKINGNITNIFVRENQFVKKGQIISEIDNNVQKEQIDYLNKKLMEIDSFLKKDGSTNLEFEKEDVTLGSIQQDYNILKSNIYDFKQSKSLYYDESIGLVKKNLNTYSSLVKINKQKLLIAEKELKNISQIFERNQRLYKEKVISNLELITKESNLNQQLTIVEGLKQDLLENQLALNDLEGQYKKQIFERSESNRKLKASILSEMKIVRNFIESWTKSYTFSAPIDGKIFFTEKFSVGFNATTDKALFVIIPNDSKLLAKVKVLSIKYGKIEKGQKVRFELDNYPYQEYGYIYGVVKDKSTVPIANEYELIVDLNNDLKTSYGLKLIYKPNMLGSANIIVENQRLIEKLLYFLRRSYN
ncbi:HlyD family efflux transporter periplasmic adaptor subunit [Pedobacter sp. SD-b]|uniref:HlyD family efflux transporter periplasmic adaptor subunit n=1 Tax=Pedobacter segetis TaxID=2793069 RepID=A0ABS1BI20_9SPHI|nr:HlyD family efflux transporter periplasmic adaptor subunit [Pedobacter segetis]MBK0382467.1 HlyD family efflux transporter periplasmic adaptor subunit [Pedobacter segetis]